jgi:alcohol dehydrogenase class IV
MVTTESFEFATAGRILFGAGRLNEAGSLVAGFGTRVLVVTGSRTRRAVALIDRLEEVEIYHQVFPVSGEPTTEIIQQGVAAARSFNAEIIVGIGGGSAIDAGKAIAAVATNPGDLFDHLEVIGKARPLVNPPLPFVALPTTAGTGAEVTRNAVIASPEHQVKVSLRSPLMLPRLAIIDPVLTYDLPAAVTAATGMDALTQLIEPYVSIKANPLTDGFCREGLVRAGRSLKKAYLDGNDTEARNDMALASLLGGLALANSGLGVVHGFAGPIGGRFTAPHGMVCATLLTESVKTNVTALKNRAPDSPALGRYQESARLILGKKRATVDDLITWLEELTRDLQIPGLRAFGTQSDHIEEMVRQSRQASSMKGNPIVLDDDELSAILLRSL